MFGCAKEPIVVGYCGDVLFPSQVLGQVVEAADCGVLFSETSSNDTRLDAVESMIKCCLQEYILGASRLAGDSVEFLLASRASESDFLCRTLRWTSKTNAWEMKTEVFKPHSYTLAVLGSGAAIFRRRFEEYQSGNDRKTSRAAYQCLCHALADEMDNFCGGAPQLVGLYNRGPARRFGIVHQGRRFLHGVEIPENADINFDGVEWRNDLFERCDPRTKRILEGAQRQPNPLRY